MARIAGRAVERPTPVIVAAVLLALIGAVAALRLEADRSPSSLVDRGSTTYAETQDFYDQFGDEPVEVLVKGDLRQLLLTEQPRQAARARELPVRQGKGGQVVHGSAGAGTVRRHREARSERRRLRPGDLPQPVRDRGEQALSAGGSGGDRSEARQAAQQAAASGQAPGLLAGTTAAGGACRVSGRTPAVPAAARSACGPLRAAGPAPSERPALCRVGDLRPEACRGAQPKARLAAIVPSAKAALISVRLRPGLSRRAASGGDIAVQAGRPRTPPST